MRHVTKLSVKQLKLCVQTEGWYFYFHIFSAAAWSPTKILHKLCWASLINTVKTLLPHHVICLKLWRDGGCSLHFLINECNVCRVFSLLLMLAMLLFPPLWSSVLCWLVSAGQPGHYPQSLSVCWAVQSLCASVLAWAFLFSLFCWILVYGLWFLLSLFGYFGQLPFCFGPFPGLNKFNTFLMDPPLVPTCVMLQ